jgi:hypothetical protein
MEQIRQQLTDAQVFKFIPGLLWNPQVYYRGHKSLLLFPEPGPQPTLFL